MQLDKWQQEVLNTKGNMVLRSGRQVGKSTIIAQKTAIYSLENSKKTIMIISKTERQAGLLFTKILLNIHEINRLAIKKGKDRPTKTRIRLKNGSEILCLPAGDTGYGIMGFTIDLLIADEAAFIPEEVWNSVVPALAITRGNIWLLSTPFVKEGYYYNCFKDPSFTAFHTSSEDCPRKDVAFLEHKKATLTKTQYKQMYLGEFIEESRQFFSDILIKKTCILSGSSLPLSLSPSELNDYFLGVDVARMGEDESTFEVMERTDKGLIHMHHETTTKTLTTDTTNKIIELNKKYDFVKEYIDSGGLGIGVCDQLRLDEDNKRKVVEINNATRGIDYEYADKARKRHILKEDLYNNLLRLMEHGEIKLLDDDEVKASLKSIQGEHDKDTGKLKIWGSDSHIAEGLIRAAWCIKDKSLNLFIY